MPVLTMLKKIADFSVKTKRVLNFHSCVIPRLPGALTTLKMVVTIFKVVITADILRQGSIF